MNNKLLNLFVLVVVLLMLSTACAPEQEDVLSETSTPEVTTEVTLAPQETQESEINVSIDVNEAKEPTATDELPYFPTVEEGMDVQFAAADTIMNGLKLETFRLTLLDDEGQRLFDGGKLTVGEDVYPFILCPDTGTLVTSAIVINEEPYNDYFFIQTTVAENTPVNYIYTFSYDSDLPIAVTRGNFRSIGKESVTLFSAVQMFGSWNGEQEYTFTPNESGAFSDCFTPVDDLWTSSADSDDGIPESSPVVTKEFEVYLKGADGEYALGTLPVGTQLMVTQAQGNNTVYFKTADGMEGYFDNYDPSAKTIGGVSENELVEHSPIAGEASYSGPYYTDGGFDINELIAPITLEDFDERDMLSDEQLEAIRALEEYSN